MNKLFQLDILSNPSQKLMNNTDKNNEKKDKLKGRDNSIGFFKFQLFLFLKDLKCENMKRKVKRK